MLGSYVIYDHNESKTSDHKEKNFYLLLFRYSFDLPIMVSAKSSSVSDILWKMEDDDGIMIGIDRLLSLVLE